MNHPGEERLNDYVDGLLGEEEAREVRSHLDDCDECRRTATELGHLVASASRLGEIEPSRDLLPGIRKAAVKPGSGWMRWAAVAAAVGLVAVLTFMQFGSGDVATTVQSEDMSIEQLMADFRKAEAEYVRATSLLAARLEERRDDLEPEVLAVLDKNLAQIDSAIAEVREALGPDDSDMYSHQMLTALYDKKLQILWRASRLSS